jgi:large subunit ribosomal protein L9e
MKYILTEKELEIPEGITVTVKAREVIVKGTNCINPGPLGTLKRSFRHVPFDVRKTLDEKSKKNKLVFQMWLQKKKQTAVLGTVRGIINNMIRGVTSGYKFKMVLAYAHFPIIVNILDNGKVNIIVYLGPRN